MPSRIEAAAMNAAIDADLLSEALSAWMDGEHLPHGVHEAVVLQWLLQDAGAQQKWQQWHAHAEYLRVFAVAGAQQSVGDMPVLPSGMAAVGSASWHASLRLQLAQTRAGSADGDGSSSRQAWPAQQAGAKALAVTPASAGRQQTVPAEAAANDPVWRWKLAAGFASLAAVGVMAWSLLSQQTAPAGREPLQAAAHGSSQATLAALVAQQEAAPDMQGQQQEAGQHAEAPDAAPALASIQLAAATADDAYAEALMQAHAQMGENLLLQDALLTEQDERF